MQFTQLKTILTHYDTFLIDLWGVVHNGVKPYAGVVECLNFLIAGNQTVFFLSNAPRPAPILIKKLIEFGIKVTPEMLVTSGDLVRYQLTYFEDSIFNKLSKQFYHLGAERNQDILTGIQVNVVSDLKKAGFILLTAYIEDDEDLNQYDSFLKKAVQYKIPIVCANPDRSVINGDRLRFCPGFLAEKFEKMGGTVYYYGKPYLNIYETIFKKLQEKNNYHKKRILMIGDTLETDIVGAKTANIDSALVLTGNMHNLLNENINANISQSEILGSLFKKYNITPTWIIPSLSLAG